MSRRHYRPQVQNPVIIVASGSVGTPPSHHRATSDGSVGGTISPTIEGGTPISTAGMAYGVYLNKIKPQFDAFLKQLQDRYNLKRAYAGLSKQPVQFNYSLLTGGAAGNSIKVSGAAALFLMNRLQPQNTDSYAAPINGEEWFYGGSPATFGSYQATSAALPAANAADPHGTAQRYENIASLADTDQGGDNPFAVALPDAVYASPFRAVFKSMHGMNTRIISFTQEQAMEVSYRACIKSITDVLVRRTNSLDSTFGNLLALIETQVNFDKKVHLSTSADPSFQKVGPRPSAAASAQAKTLIIRKAR